MKKILFLFFMVATFSCVQKEQLPSVQTPFPDQNTVVSDRDGICQCSIKVNSIPPTLEPSYIGVWAVDGVSGIYNYWAGEMLYNCEPDSIHIPNIRVDTWYEFNLPKPLSYRVAFNWSSPCGPPGESGISSVTIKCGSSSNTWELSTASANPTYAFFDLTSTCQIAPWE